MTAANASSSASSSVVVSDEELILPSSRRPLTPADESHLRTVFELQLATVGNADEDREDASDLLDYALDMIGRGKSVGSVTEELAFMEYGVCDRSVAQNIGKQLASFLRELAQSRESAHSSREPVAVVGNNIDLSTKAASRKPSREMHETLLSSSGSVSVKERSRRGIYNSRGELTKQWAGIVDVGNNNNNPIDFEEHRRGVLQAAREERKAQERLNLSASAAAAKHHREVNALDHSNGRIKEKIYSRDGRLNSWNRRLSDSSAKEMDLSTSGNLKKKAKELERLRSTGSARRGVKGKIYDGSGQLNAWKKYKQKEEAAAVVVTDPDSNPGEEEEEEEEWTPAAIAPRVRGNNQDLSAASSSSSSSSSGTGERRRKELEAIMRDRSLNREQRAEKIEEIKARYAPPPSSAASATRRDGDAVVAAMDLSTSGNLKKKARELERLRSTGSARRGVKGKIYDQSGRLNAWSKWEGKEEQEEEEEQQHNAQHQGGHLDLSAEGMERKKALEIESLRASMNSHSSRSNMYDADGNIVGANNNNNNEGTQDRRHDRDMDLSAEGMRRKKSREMDRLRASANAAGLRRRMYNDRGELVGSVNNNDGEQDRHNPDMDLSAEGMKLKKAREMEALRRAGRGLKEGAKKSMYDEGGRLNAWNSRQKNGETARMDLSTAGSIKKKDAELDAIRATGRARRGVKDKIYDASGQLNAWTNLRESEELDAEFEEEMDLSAEGMKLKKAREIESLRSSMNDRTDKPQMYDTDGNIVGANNNNGEQDRHNQDMDSSAEGMKRKKMQEINAIRAASDPQGLKQEMYNERGEIVSARNNGGEKNKHKSRMDVSAGGMMRKKALEIEAIRNGSVDHEGTVAPRALTQEETSSLRTALKSMLNIPNDSYEEDASDLLDYAFDMIGDGKAVSHVTKELVFMEMDVLTADIADGFGQCISTFLLGLGGKVTLRRRSQLAMYDENESIIQKQNKENEETKEPRIQSEDDQRRGELQSIMKDRSLSHDEREKRIEEVKARYGSASQPNQGDGNGFQTGILKLNEKTPEAKALEVKRRQEFQALMRDRSLSREERAERIEEMKIKYSAASASTHTASVKDAQKDANLDLSALAFARKAKAEMKASLLSSEKSAKQRMKEEIYDSNGVLLKQWDIESDEDEPAVHGINLSAQAAANRAAAEVDSLLVKKKSGGGLQHRMSNYQKFVEPKGLYHHEGCEHDEVRMKGLDFSAKAAAKKTTREVSAILSTGAESVKERSKHGNYDSNGVLIKQWANVETEDITDIDAHIDEQRRLYYQQLEEEKICDNATSKRDQLLAEQTKYGQGNSMNGGPEFRLSARSQARKPQEEIKALRAIADSDGVKKAIYDENGVLVKQWANFNEDGSADAGEGHPQQFLDESNRSGGNSASVSENAALDEKRKQEFQAIMRDRSLSRDARAERIELMKRKYSNGGQVVASTGRDPEKCTDLDLSAMAFARKTSAEVKATLLSSSTSAKERSKQGIYDSNGILIKQWANVNGEEGGNDESGEDDIREPSHFKSFMSRSVDEQRRAEIQLIMRDRTLTKDERAERIEEVKASYAAAAAGECASPPPQDDSPRQKTKSSNRLGESDTLDAQRRKELKAIMKNRRLDMEEKNRLMEEVKLKYDLMADDEASSEVIQVEDTNCNVLVDSAPIEEEGNKSSNLIDATQADGNKLGNGLPTEDYGDFLAVEKANEQVKTPEEEGNEGIEENGSPIGVRDVPPVDQDEENQDEANCSSSDVLDDPPIDLPTETYSEKCMREFEAVRANAALERSRKVKDSAPQDEEESTQSSGSIKVSEDTGKGPEANDLIEATQEEERRPEANGPTNHVNDEPPMDLSAASFSQKHLKELETIKKTTRGSSIKDRMAVFNKDTTVYYDSVQFAASQKESESGRRTAKTEAVQSANKYNYSYDDGKPKSRGEGAKVPVKSYRAKTSPTINCDPLAFAVKNNKSEAARKAVKRDTRESSKMYNYTFGDGGVAEETSAEFKAIGDADKAAKKESKESAKNYKYEIAPAIDCDPLAFAMKNNKSEAARKAVKRNTKESAKLYDYRYTG